MRTTTIMVVAALCVLATGSVSAVETTAPETPELVVPMNTQNGISFDCLDWNLLWLGPGHSPLAPFVDVSPGADWTGATDIGFVHVDFHDAQGFYLTSGTDSGTVPANADYGVVCVGLLGGWPDVPVTAAAFSYTEGK